MTDALLRCRQQYNDWKSKSREFRIGIYQKEYRNSHQQKLSEYNQTYYKKHKQKAIDYNRTRYHLNKRFTDALKNRPCMDCQGWFEPCQMDFDHRDPAVKIGDIAWMKRISRPRLMEEVKKCDIVCSNCHRLRTKKQVYDKNLYRSPQ